jgi:bifunctional non-homologous end joining protein LigD
MTRGEGRGADTHAPPSDASGGTAQTGLMADRSLREYRHKRVAGQTPEPFGAAPIAGAANAGGFVVQQHSARRMHWDLRLEIGGVLVSWAVPRGPSVDPKEKRLAVRTEDHPLEYADFEGIIPPGNYGAGAMIVWDRGVYRTVSGAAAADELDRGKLDVEFQGHKLRGRWALVRIKGQGGKNWLLIKKADGQPTRPEVVVAHPGSILSGLAVEELQQGRQRTHELATRAHAAGAPKRMPDAAAVRPMLAETVDAAFSRAGWIFELKYDGVRLLASRAASGQPHLYYRTGRETTAVFPEVARAVGHLPCEAFIVDGEVVALEERGTPSFERLQQRLGRRTPAEVARGEIDVPVLMFCFDLLAVAGYDLRNLPLTTRKDMLRALLPETGVLRFADHLEQDGDALFREVSRVGVEGIVGKRAASTYQSGRRSRDWLKIKARRTADVAIVGFTRGKGARQPLGALMVAWWQQGELMYAGNVGAGLDTQSIRTLLPVLERAVRRRPAFRGAPPGPVRAQVFVEPQLVAEVQYAEVTSSGSLRQPVFLHMRTDKTVADCAAPAARPSPALRIAPQPPEPGAPPALRVTNVDKIFWPEDGYTKGDLLHYYEHVWPLIGPYLRDRPLVLTRYPDGITGKSFFQKNAPDFTPEWVETCRVEDTDYFICNELRTLLYVINSGCIPVHVWSARRGTLNQPDWAILDLDPKGAPFVQVVSVAQHIHRLLAELQLPHFVKTSGQDGLHVLVPLGGRLTHKEARTFAEVLARVVVAEQQDLATVSRPLNARGGKVYIDFLQNGFGKTIAAPFSVRPRRGAPVSTPLAWREVSRRLEVTRFTIRTVPARFRRRADPMHALLATDVDVHAAVTRLMKRLG